MGELLIGVLTGLVTSIVAWILTQTLLQPRVRFSRGISVVASANTPCGFRYRVKIQNVGLVRSALDLQARAVVTVRGLDPRRPNSWSSFKLEMSSSARPRIRPGGNMAWSIDPRSLTERGKELLRDLGFADVADNDNRTLEQLLDIRGPFREGQLRPEPAHLVVQALVNDGWTGKQFYKGSTEYFNNGIDLQQRRFKIGTSSRWRRYGERARGIHRALEFADKADDEA